MAEEDEDDSPTTASFDQMGAGGTGAGGMGGYSASGPDYGFLKQQTAGYIIDSNSPHPTAFVSRDQYVAAQSLEYEKRGFQVNLVSPDSLSPQQQAEGFRASMNSRTQPPQVTMVVDDPQAVAQFRTDMKDHPQAFQAQMDRAKREVNNFIAFDQIPNGPNDKPSSSPKSAPASSHTRIHPVAAIHQVAVKHGMRPGGP